MSEKDENIVNEEFVEETQAEAAKSSEKKNQKRWYIVHTYSGYENKVKSNLEKRIEYMNMADKIFRVEVPQKTVTQIKGGRKQEKEEKIFPGYVLVDTQQVLQSSLVQLRSLFLRKKVKSKRLFTVLQRKFKKLKWMLKLVKKSESHPDHLRNLWVTLQKFTLIRLN